MSGYQPIVSVVNRTTRPLDCMDDGRPFVVPPGYKVVPDIDKETGEQRVKKVKGKDGKPVEEPQFKVVGAGPNEEPLRHPLLSGQAIRARRQHVLRGSQDPAMPSVAETLIGVIEFDDPIDHQEQVDNPEMMNRALLPEQLQGATTLRNPHHIDRARRRTLSDPTLQNPTGLRMDY